jgi:histidine ammonia-lyase
MQMQFHEISSTHIDFKGIREIIDKNKQLRLGSDAIYKINRCREYIDNKLSSGNNIYYGINTGFGSLYNKIISTGDLEQLQANLVMSHACGTGSIIDASIIRLMLLLKIQGLSYGHSGVKVETIQRLIDFYNNDVFPVVYEQGSLGASGDLAPLAHLSLPLLGLGEVIYKDKIISGKEINAIFNWQPLKLSSKEGLALLNGTQFMSAYATSMVIECKRLLNAADVVSSISVEAFDGRPEPFHHLIQQVRPHKGQITVALNIRKLLNGSEIISQKKNHVQDPYAFRCIPQVHGASRNAWEHVAFTVFNEINSVTDNPTVFPEEDLIISAGNFHGQPLALTLDYLAIAMSEIASISERRTYQLISGQRGLPPFLIKSAGLNSGFMIPQYTAASIVSQNKQLCTPASVDSIVSSNGQEDHVSMGANAATKLYKLCRNVETVLAIELFNAVQAIEFRRPLRSSDYIEEIIRNYRQKVDFIETDKVLYPEISKSVQFLRTSDFDEYLE